jgi:hypothetical protein
MVQIHVTHISGFFFKWTSYSAHTPAKCLFYYGAPYKTVFFSGMGFITGTGFDSCSIYNTIQYNRGFIRAFAAKFGVKYNRVRFSWSSQSLLPCGNKLYYVVGEFGCLGVEEFSSSLQEQAVPLGGVWKRKSVISYTQCS